MQTSFPTLGRAESNRSESESGLFIQVEKDLFPTQAVAFLIAVRAVSTKKGKQRDGFQEPQRKFCSEPYRIDDSFLGDYERALQVLTDLPVSAFNDCVDLPCVLGGGQLDRATFSFKK